MSGADMPLDKIGRHTPGNLLLVYKALGRVLNSPQSFGLGEWLPKPLTEALTVMRRSLREELVEEDELSSADWLSSELSQDADRCRRVKVPSAKAKTCRGGLRDMQAS